MHPVIIVGTILNWHPTSLVKFSIDLMVSDPYGWRSIGSSSWVEHIKKWIDIRVGFGCCSRIYTGGSRFEISWYDSILLEYAIDDLKEVIKRRELDRLEKLK